MYKNVSCLFSGLNTARLEACLLRGMKGRVSTAEVSPQVV